MAFCTYQATFIAVKEPKSGPRSKSAGANVPRQPCPETSYVESLEKRASALTFLEAPSEGSAGHPQLCNKPCLFLTYGACPSGAGCNFCHLPHPNQAKLGRSDRELLRLLGEADLLALILPHLRAKKIQGSDPLLGLMEAHLASLVAAPSQIRGLANVGRRLGRLSFRQLLFLSSRRPGVPGAPGVPGVPGVQAALEALKSSSAAVFFK
ncbi:unnamed protein product [Effrenium voratum]|uniref:C3H1-type domain-containing protein n=1 Tax=Effrenium voratum TaxID=2562239 RepID=A0AA36NHC6_9DINO|nr:unnamed protein product [Effrenium voratum]